MIICKTNPVHEIFKSMFTTSETKIEQLKAQIDSLTLSDTEVTDISPIQKEYHALVFGKMGTPKGIICKPIARHPKFGYKMTVFLKHMLF